MIVTISLIKPNFKGNRLNIHHQKISIFCSLLYYSISQLNSCIYMYPFSACIRGAFLIYFGDDRMSEIKKNTYLNNCNKYRIKTRQRKKFIKNQK